MLNSHMRSYAHTPSEDIFVSQHFNVYVSIGLRLYIRIQISRLPLEVVAFLSEVGQNRKKLGYQTLIFKSKPFYFRWLGRNNFSTPIATTLVYFYSY